MCWSKPSRDQRHADQQQEAQRQHLHGRVALDEVADRSADSSMTPTAMTTAGIMTPTCSAMPTAVITESSENTMSSSRIWMMTPANEAATCAEAWPSSPSSLS